MKYVDRLLRRFDFGLISLTSVATAILFIVGFIGYTAVLQQQIKNYFIQEESDELQKFTQIIQRQVDRGIAREAQAIDNRAKIMADMGIYDLPPNVKQKWINSAVKIDDVTWMAFVRPNGAIDLATDYNHVRGNLIQERWFNEGLKNVYVSTIDGDYAKEMSDNDRHQIIIAAPVSSRSGHVAGVLVAHLSWKSVIKNISHVVDEIDRNEGLRYAIFDNGRLLIGDADFGSALGQAVSLKSSHPVKLAVGDQSYLASVASLATPSLNWEVVAYEPYHLSDIYYDILRTFWIGGLVGLALCLGFIGTIYRWVKARTSMELGAESDAGSDAQWVPNEIRSQTKEISGLRNAVEIQQERIEIANQMLQQSFSGFSDRFPGYLIRISAPVVDPLMHRIEYASPSVSKYLGVTFKTLKEDPFAAQKYIPEGDLKFALERFENSAKDLQPFDVIFRSNWSSSAIWMHLSAAVHLSSDRIVWDCLVLDITALKEAEEVANRASQEKSFFLATLSHEIRTPLNGILGFAQLMETDNDMSECSKHQITIIRESAESLATILGDVLDASSLDLDKMELHKATFNLNDLFISLAGFYKPLAEAKNLDFICGECPVFPLVYGDPVRLRQIISNLISNAIKYTQTGSITCVCDALVTGNILNLAIAVQDTGIGIKISDQDQLFSKFYQVHNINGVRTSGSGLGLFIARSLADKMQGSIGVESELGRGSRFTLQVQLDISKDAPSNDAANKIGSKLLKILVVDDYAINRNILRTYLERLGHNVHEAANGAEAIDQAKLFEPDIIFMDVEMPEMNGLDATRHIRRYTGNSELPTIIAMTGLTTFKDKEECWSAGMNDYLTKPVDFKVVDKIIENRQPTTS